MGDKTNTLKSTILLAGEKQYNAAMRSIITALKESKSAQRAASAEFKASGDDMRQAAAYSEALADTYSVQSRQLDEMERHLKDVEEKYGANSREAAQLRTKINNVRTEMARTVSEMKDFERGLENLADGGGDAGAGMEAIGEGAAQAAGQVGGLAGRLGELAGGKLGSLLGGLTIGAGVTLVEKGLQAGDEVTRAENRLAAMTGLEGEALEEVNATAKKVYEQGFGESIGEAANSTAILYQSTKETGEALYDVTAAAHALDSTFNMDIPESARTASQMMNIFGVSGVEAYDLIAAAAQDGADKNGNLLDTINEYAPYFKQAGLSAEEFLGALAAGTEHGVYDIDKIGDGMKEFTLRIGDGSETTRQALEALGIEATDLPAKFGEGGDGAAAALALVVDKLNEIEDANLRNQLGIALFGTQWEDTAGALLPIFDQITEGALDGDAAIEQMLSGRADELSTQAEIAWRQVSGDFAEFFQPASEAIANGLDAVNQRAQETGESYIAAAGGVVSDVIGAQVEGAAASVKTWVEGVEADLSAWLDSPGGPLTEAATTYAAAAQAVGKETATGISAGLLAENQAIKAAVEQTNTEAIQVYSGLPEKAAQSITDGTPQVQQAAQQMAQEAPDALDAEKTTMETAAEGLAIEAEEALEAGIVPMGDAGEEMGDNAAQGLGSTKASTYAAAYDIADGAVSELRRAIPGSYAAGYAAGKAFERGYRNATDTHSPSRKLRLASQDVIAGALEPLERAESAVYARGAALGAALEDGYRGRALGGANAPVAGADGAEGISTEALAEALTAAISGLALYASGEKIGQVGAASAGRAMSRAGLESIAGRANAARSW